jgi:hypothetical protein
MPVNAITAIVAPNSRSGHVGTEPSSIVSAIAGGSNAVAIPSPTIISTSVMSTTVSAIVRRPRGALPR